MATYRGGYELKLLVSWNLADGTEFKCWQINCSHELCTAIPNNIRGDIMVKVIIKHSTYTLDSYMMILLLLIYQAR